MNATTEQWPLRRIEPKAPAFADCAFYHAVDLPGGKSAKGQWDLRPNVDKYLGDVDFRGKRVLEVGPASGYLSFYMESRGASVVAIEPPMDSAWDFVPRKDQDLEAFKKRFESILTRIRNSFWYLHRLNSSKVELYEASAYALPEELGTFDVGLLASILLHTRSPVSIMEQLAKRVTGTLIISETYIPDLGKQPVCRLRPGVGRETMTGWWDFTPKFFTDFLYLLGFPKAVIVRHKQLRTIDSVRSIEMFTVVASRT